MKLVKDKRVNQIMKKSSCTQLSQLLSSAVKRETKFVIGNIQRSEAS